MNASLAVLGWTDLAATIVLAGGLFFAAIIVAPSESGRRWRWRAVAALAVVLPAEFCVTALRMYEVSGLHGRVLVLDLLRTRWGLLWMGRSAGVALLAAGGSLPAGPLAALAAAWLVLRALGAVNHFGHVPAMRRGEPEAETSLIRAVRFEILVGTLVLALTALLGVLPMPHSHAP